jgi:hypothetical protein
MNKTIVKNVAALFATVALPVCVFAGWWEYREPWAGSDATGCGTMPNCSGTCWRATVITGPAAGGWCVSDGVYCSGDATSTTTLNDVPYNCVPSTYGCACGGNQTGNPVIRVLQNHCD